MHDEKESKAGAKWTDETLSMAMRRQLMAEELKQLGAPRGTESAESAGSPTPRILKNMKRRPRSNAKPDA